MQSQLELDIENEALCPITLSTLIHPVTASDGTTYEAQELLNWFTSSLSTISPKTKEPLTFVMYNHDLKKLIDTYKKENTEDYDIKPIIAELNRILAMHNFKPNSYSFWRRTYDAGLECYKAFVVLYAFYLLSCDEISINQDVTLYTLFLLDLMGEFVFCTSPTFNAAHYSEHTPHA